MGLYISGKRISELPTLTSWDKTDLLTGLKSADNANISIGELSDIVQADIDTLDPRPPATFAKVMYYDGSKWGASQTFVTDGNLVGIGISAPTGTSQLELKSNGTSDYMLNLYKKDGSDFTIKNMLYSEYGILHVTESGPIFDTSTASLTYGLIVEKGIVAQKDIFLDNDNASKLKFGQHSGADGTFTEAASIYSSANYLGVKSKTIELIDNAGIKYIGYTNDGPIRTSNSMFFKLQTWHDTGSPQSGGIVLSSNTISSTAPDDSVKSALHIGGNNAGNENMITISLDPNVVGHTDTQIVLKIDKDGKIFGRFPTVVGNNPSGTLLQLYNDGGSLKLG
jgi:hypothetical protein